MPERIPSLTPIVPDAIARYEETKDLAQMAFVGFMMNSMMVQHSWDNLAEQAWNAAESLYAESERRRPVE